jgi:hypothetical protein
LTRSVPSRSGRAGKRALSALLFALLSFAPSFAGPSAGGTFLIGIGLGSGLSALPREARPLGYELSGGGRMSFEAWYRVRVPDLRMNFLTELTPDLGLLWGVGTGEYGEKYRIGPSLRLGLLYTRTVGANGVFSVRLATRLGGRLREKACTADYGGIGGVQRVNCRLAAAPLAPGETLDYLWNERPGDRVEASVGLTFRF